MNEDDKLNLKESSLYRRVMHYSKLNYNCSSKNSATIITSNANYANNSNVNKNSNLNS